MQITFVLPEALALEAEQVANLISIPGKRASRADALRAAIARGIAAIREEVKK